MAETAGAELVDEHRRFGPIVAEEIGQDERGAVARVVGALARALAEGVAHQLTQAWAELNGAAGVNAAAAPLPTRVLAPTLATR